MLTVLTLGQAGLFAGLGAFAIVLWVIGIIASIFWIWMLIDCLASSMPTNEKVLWFLVIFFLHFIGAVVYYVMRKSGGTRHAMT